MTTEKLRASQKIINIMNKDGHNKIWEIMNQKISINNEMTQHFPLKT